MLANRNWFLYWVPYSSTHFIPSYPAVSYVLQDSSEDETEEGPNETIHPSPQTRHAFFVSCCTAVELLPTARYRLLTHTMSNLVNDAADARVPVRSDQPRRAVNLCSITPGNVVMSLSLILPAKLILLSCVVEFRSRAIL